jgi:hypothetical protein
MKTKARKKEVVEVKVIIEETIWWSSFQSRREASCRNICLENGT